MFIRQEEGGASTIFLANDNYSIVYYNSNSKSIQTDNKNDNRYSGNKREEHCNFGTNTMMKTFVKINNSKNNNSKYLQEDVQCIMQ